ncbi:MAG: class I mannose-6-phosphate isomerase [Planctomycetota bacterium]|nr:class I mannose-6-phosphate isomerase [Planctomycetota bacterium]
MSIDAPLFLEPHVRPTRWGDGELLSEFGVHLGDVLPTAGEVWLASDYPGRESRIKNDPEQRNLADLMKSDGAFILGDSYKEGATFPLIIKFLMIGGRLSVQVHPDGESARQLELSDRGKHEAWWILGARPEATIYFDLNGQYEQRQLAEAIAEDRFQEFLNLFIPKANDFFDIPPGTFHAGGNGLLLLEVQERCDVTLRVYDWGNKETELHVDKALEIGMTTRRKKESPLAVAAAPFDMNRMELEPGQSEIVGERKSAEVIVVSRGNVELQFGKNQYSLKAGDTTIWPAALASGRILTKDGASILRTFPMNR